MTEVPRLAVAALRAWRAPSVGLLDAAVIHVRAALADLDPFGHVTNSRYLHYLDLGRLDFLIRAGWIRAAWTRRVIYVVGALDIRFRRPLRWRDRIELTTRVATWDQRWVVFEQQLRVGGESRAAARSRLQFRGRGGCVALRDLAGISPDVSPGPVDDAAWMPG